MQDQAAQQRQFLAAYDQYADAIFRHCFFKTNNREVAKDLAQQTFVNAWAYLQKGRNIDEFRPFFYRTAHNLIIDWYRRHKTDSLDALVDEGFNLPDTHQATEQQLEWQRALLKLKQLSEEDQQLITWRYVEDYSPGEIAKLLKVKENIASVRIHRAVQRFQKFL